MKPEYTNNCKEAIVLLMGDKGLECYLAADGVHVESTMPSCFGDIEDGILIQRYPPRKSITGNLIEYGDEFTLDETTAKRLSHYNLRTRCKNLRKKIDRLNKQIEYLERNRESLERQYNSEVDDYEKFSKFMETMRKDYHDDYMAYAELEMIKSGMGDLVSMFHRTEPPTPIDEVIRPRVTQKDINDAKNSNFPFEHPDILFSYRDSDNIMHREEYTTYQDFIDKYSVLDDSLKPKIKDIRIVFLNLCECKDFESIKSACEYISELLEVEIC